MNNIPINHVHRSEGDLLIVVNVNADIPASVHQVSGTESTKKQSLYQKKIKDFYGHLRKSSPGGHEEKLGYFSLMTKTIDLMTIHMAEISLKNYSPDILMNISRESCTIYDFYKAEEMVEIGRQVAISSIESFHSKMK